MKGIKNYVPKGVLRAKLSFDEGFAEEPIYTIKGYTSEKIKGIDMMELIQDNFNISDKDRKKAFREKLKELNEDAMKPTKLTPELTKHQIKWTRDKKGNIVIPQSPYAKK